MSYASWQQRYKVEALELAVRAGFPIFSRYKTGWRIRLPVGTAEVGARLIVKRDDGSTAHVEITRVIGDYPQRKPTFTLVEFKNVPPVPPYFARVDGRWLIRVPLDVAVGTVIEVPTRDGAPARVRVTGVVSTRPDIEVPDALVEFEDAELDKPS